MQQASKTSVSRDTSSKFYIGSFQNEHFVRDVLHFSFFEAVKSTVSCLNLFPRSSKSMIFCEASAKMLPLPRLLTLRFTNTASLPCHKMLRLPRDWTRHQHKALRLPRENDNSDTLLKSRALRLPRKTQTYANATSTHVAKRNTSTLRARFCEDIDLQHVILITFKREHRPMVRLSDLRYTHSGKKQQINMHLGFEKHCLETPKRTTLI